METINLKTFDGIDLAADYYEAKKPIMAAVYAHMMPAAKESWRDLAEYLAQNGISGLAIDLRGHGQSTLGPDGYKSFKPADHQESTFDLSAAAEFLHSLGHSFKHEKIIFIGASIGANSTILPGVTIGEKSFVAAGSVVTHDVPPKTLVAGVPTKVIRKISKAFL